MKVKLIRCGHYGPRGGLKTATNINECANTLISQTRIELGVNKSKQILFKFKNIYLLNEYIKYLAPVLIPFIFFDSIH